MGDLVPWPGTEPGTPAFAGRRSRHWATRKIPPSDFTGTHTHTHTHTHTLPWCSVVKSLPAGAGRAEDAGLIPGLGRSPAEGNGSPLSILAWRTPWTEEPGGLQSMGLQSWTQLSTCVRAHTHAAHTHARAYLWALLWALPIVLYVMFSLLFLSKYFLIFLVIHSQIFGDFADIFVFLDL